MQTSAGNKAVSGLRRFIVRQSDVAGGVSQCRRRSDDSQLRANIQSPDRTKAVTSFYFQSAIDQAAAKVSKGLALFSVYLVYHSSHNASVSRFHFRCMIGIAVSIVHLM